MVRNFAKSALFLTLILALNACNTARDNKALTPYAVGNYWTYDVETYLNDAVDPATSNEHTIKIEEEINWGEHTWYGYKKDGNSEYYRNAEEGMYSLEFNDAHPDGSAKLVIEYPLKVGSSWSVETEGLEPVVITTTVVEADDETVVVPAGIFDDCLRCNITMSDMSFMEGQIGNWVKQTKWFKPGVGWVKMEIVFTTWEQVFLLKEYHVK
ncbi:hypothetical protein K9N50_01600 [bacterium]|nr:hypothetical protein [bacterium]